MSIQVQNRWISYRTCMCRHTRVPPLLERVQRYERFINSMRFRSSPQVQEYWISYHTCVRAYVLSQPWTCRTSSSKLRIIGPLRYKNHYHRNIRTCANYCTSTRKRAAQVFEIENHHPLRCRNSLSSKKAYRYQFVYEYTWMLLHRDFRTWESSVGFNFGQSCISKIAHWIWLGGAIK